MPQIPRAIPGYLMMDFDTGVKDDIIFSATSNYSLTQVSTGSSGKMYLLFRRIHPADRPYQISSLFHGNYPLYH